MRVVALSASSTGSRAMNNFIGKKVGIVTFDAQLGQDSPVDHLDPAAARLSDL